MSKYNKQVFSKFNNKARRDASRNKLSQSQLAKLSIPKVSDDEEVDITKEGSLVQITPLNENKEIGMVLKYIPDDLLTIDQGICTGDDFIVIGTYQKHEIIKAVEEDANNKPKLTIIMAKVKDKKSYDILIADQKYDENLKNNELMNALFEIAKKDNKINERTQELLRTTIMACISGDMSKSYKENLEKLMKN